MECLKDQASNIVQRYNDKNQNKLNNLNVSFTVEYSNEKKVQS